MIRHNMYRARIDQPSTLQPLHHMHGTNVIVDPNSLKSNGGDSVTVALLEGPVITMVVPLMALAEGWSKSSTKGRILDADQLLTVIGDAQEKFTAKAEFYKDRDYLMSAADCIKIIHEEAERLNGVVK